MPSQGRAVFYVRILEFWHNVTLTCTLSADKPIYTLSDQNSTMRCRLSLYTLYNTCMRRALIPGALIRACVVLKPVVLWPTDHGRGVHLLPPEELAGPARAHPAYRGLERELRHPSGHQREVPLHGEYRVLSGTATRVVRYWYWCRWITCSMC